MQAKNRCILFDWGGTLMRDYSEFSGPMVKWPRIGTMEYVPEVLTRLHQTWMLALATNAVDSDEGEIWAALRRCGLDQFLDKVYCLRMIGYKKPSPEFFEYILRDLGIDRSKVVMVGDDFDSDVLGAARSGIHAVWFNRDSLEIRKGELYDTIHDFRSLPQALAKILR